VAKKGLSVWLVSSLTFVSLVHLADAISALFFGNPVHLLQLYPFIGEQLQSLTPETYLLAAAASTLVCWGLTCMVTFDSPIEQFLHKILSDAKKQTAVEAQMVAEKSDVLDAMYETIEASNETLSGVVDIVRNVKNEVKCIQPLKLTVDDVKTELGNLKKEVMRIEEKTKFPLLCGACGKPLSPEFNLCPYCGKNIKLHDEVIAVKTFR